MKNTKNFSGFRILMALVVPTIVLSLLGIYFRDRSNAATYVVLFPNDVPIAIDTEMLPQNNPQDYTEPAMYNPGKIEGSWYNFLWSVDAKPGDVVRLFEKHVAVDRFGYQEGTLDGLALFAEIKHQGVDEAVYVRLNEGVVIITGK